jgi:hypothetical protein
MIKDYRAARFAEAAQATTRLRETAPESLRPLYEMYAERIGDLLATPPVGDWDGVFTSLEK